MGRSIAILHSQLKLVPRCMVLQLPVCCSSLKDVWKTWAFGAEAKTANKHVLCLCEGHRWDNLFCFAEELLTVGILLACFYDHLEKKN